MDTRKTALRIVAAAPWVYLALLRPCQLRQGATPDGAHRDLPGDDLVAHYLSGAARANRGTRGRARGGAEVVCARLLLAVLAFLLAACGGSGGGPAKPSGSGPTASTPGTAPTSTATPTRPAAITVRSPAFAEGAAIPARYSCRGLNTPPALIWTGIPPGAASIALVMDDPDAVGGTYTHWVVFNLPATASGITGGHLPAGAAQAQNSGGRAGYLGPCPPSGTHHYRFTVYAEPNRLPLPAEAPLAKALHAIKSDAIAAGRLTGLFSG